MIFAIFDVSVNTSSAENTTIVTRVFMKNEFFISSESLFYAASTGVNFTLPFLIYLV